MKKLLTVMLSLILAVGCIGLMACSKSSVEGTYKLNSMTMAGQTINVGEEAPWGDEILSADTMVIELKADNVAVVKATMFGETEEQDGTWSKDGNKITITIDGESQTATLDGDMLTIDAEEMICKYKKA